MTEAFKRQIDSWAGNQALTVLHRVLTLILVPVLFLAGTMLLAHEARVSVLERHDSDMDRRVALVEAQARDAQVQASGIRADIAALSAGQSATQRQLDRIERLLERRADSGARGASEHVNSH